MLFRVLCETVRDFVELVGKATSSIDEDDENTESHSLSKKCLALQNKLTLLLQTLKIESDASTIFSSLGESRRSSTMENIEASLKDVPERIKWHSDTTLASEAENSNMHQNHKSIKFIAKEHLWSRANSLKKALRDIIDHTERGFLCLFVYSDYIETNLKKE